MRLTSITCSVFLTFAFSVGYVNPIASDPTFAAGAVYTTLPGFWSLSVLWTLNARAAQNRQNQSEGGFVTTVFDTTRTKEWDDGAQSPVGRSRTEVPVSGTQGASRGSSTSGAATTSRLRSFDSMVDEGEVVQPLHRHPVDAAVSSMLSGLDVD
uniref:Uncharacterized protein n=1 Tax=Mycena chlorophos TaxID=658473 RepID=A0ABQ0KXL3_MYCCL|nr:predicted protein [Mycena chlorophos]